MTSHAVPLFQGRNPQTSAWDKHAPLQSVKVSKPRLPPPPLPLDEALAEIRSSTASIIDFQASLVMVMVIMMAMAMAMVMAMAMPL